MAALQQPSTMQAPNYQGVSPLDPEYVNQQVAGYQKRTQPAYRSGLRDLRSYIRSSRGLGDSGIEASQVAGLEQQRMSDLGDFTSGAQQQQAQALEQQRQRERGRQWQVEDRDFARRAQLDDAQRAAQGQLWQTILNPVGSLVGQGLGSIIGGRQKTDVPDFLQPSLDYMGSTDMLPPSPEDMAAYYRGIHGGR